MVDFQMILKNGTRTSLKGRNTLFFVLKYFLHLLLTLLDIFAYTFQSLFRPLKQN